MEELFKDLLEINSILKTLDYKPLLVGATLLGYVRDNNPKPIDGDLDIILCSPNKLVGKDNYFVEEKFRKVFKDKGFIFTISNPKPFFGAIFSLQKRGKTDVLVHEEFNGDYCLGYNQFYRAYPKEMFDNPEEIEIKGNKFFVPSPKEEFLFLKYGDWKNHNAPTIEKKKILTKEQYLLLKEQKILWRTKEKDRVWNNIDLVDKMENYFNNVVYTAGCFDVIHKGHIAFLNKCATFGHKLIVGLGTDEYIKGFKGEGRPIMNYDERQSILNNHKLVWKVVPHAPEFDIKVYDEEKINVLVIGDDFADTPEHKVRIEEAKKREIKIITIPRTPKISTTEIIKRCKNG